MESIIFSIALFLNALEDPFAFALLVSATTLGIALVNRTSAVSFFCSIALTFAVVHIVKSIFEVARPEDAIAIAKGYRFPSMHAAIAAAFIGSGTLYLKRHISSGAPRALLYGFAALLITFVAWTRLILGVHRPVDVAVGAVIGLVLSYLIHLLVERYAK